MKGLDFWATDDWTDGQEPMWDEWSIKFMFWEWQREVFRDELSRMLAESRDKLMLARRRG